MKDGPHQQQLFRGGTLRAEREPLLHFFEPCEMLNHKIAAEKCFCAISNSCPDDPKQ